ncbi:MAG TPA: hypothetical protein PLU10_06500, partial [Chitinophagaceae bacterium]|nr:hypothetical protein [Chitinophagaceae bacterium]
MYNFIRIVGICLLLFCSVEGQAQKATKNADIHEVINTFMDCIVHYDSVKFYNLFHSDPVTWVGVFHEASQAEERKQDATRTNNFFNTNYKSFYRSL